MLSMIINNELFNILRRGFERKKNACEGGIDKFLIWLYKKDNIRHLVGSMYSMTIVTPPIPFLSLSFFPSIEKCQKDILRDLLRSKIISKVTLKRVGDKALELRRLPQFKQTHLLTVRLFSHNTRCPYTRIGWFRDSIYVLTP